MRKLQKGMTLIELVIVIIVLGIIAAVAAPKFADVSGNAVTASIEGSGGAFKSAYVIAIAQQQGVPTLAQLDALLDGFTCTALTGPCDTGDQDGDGNADLSITVYFSDCTTATAMSGASDTVQGYGFNANGAGEVCEL